MPADTAEPPPEQTLEIHVPTNDGIPLDAAGLLEQREFQWGIISATGIVLRDETPKVEILRLIEMALGLEERLCHRHCEVLMKCGDLLRFAEEKLGEEYAQAIDGVRKSLAIRQKTLDNAMWICSKVSANIRRPDTLTLSHHEAVAKLPHDEQAEYLRLADNEGMSVSELKKKIAADHPGKPRGPKATVEVKINTDNPQAIKDALAILTKHLTEQEADIDDETIDALETLAKLWRRHRQNGHAKKQELAEVAGA